MTNTMLQGQMNKEKMVAHRGNFNMANTSKGVVRKGLLSKTGFITPNSLGARIIDADRTRFLNSYDIKILNEQTPLTSMPPNQIEANKTLLPLGILQDEQSQFPFIAEIPTNFVYKKEIQQLQEDNENDMLKKTEAILNRVEQTIQKKEVIFAG